MRKESFIALPKKLSGATILVRVDFNESIERKKIKDSFRIHATAPTLHELRRRGARLVLIAHLEDSATKKQLSFKPHIAQISKIIGMPLAFSKIYSKKALGIAPAVLLENIRFQNGETANDINFARRLASLGDLYINEAFSVSHRKHASIVGITKFLPSYAGPLLQKEVAALSEALKPKHPFLLIIGGAKFSTKVALLKNFLPKADAVFIGGALANTFLKAHGLEVGRSVIEKDALGQMANFLRSQKIILPLDAYVSQRFAKSVFDVDKGEKIFDVGPESVKMLTGLARSAKYVLWNGPLGFIEGGYDQSTRELLKNLAKMKKTKVIIGGGDTVEVLDEMRLQQHFYHVSTGGGAMLDFLADGSLPGIDAIASAQKRMHKK